MYDLIEEYFSYIIIGMIMLSIWIILIFSWENREWARNLPIEVSEINTKKDFIEESILVKENTILSGSTQNGDEQSTIVETPKKSQDVKKLFVVTRVIDWDTIDIWLDANVRILGIDAPESSAIRYGHAECDGKLASAYAKSILLEKLVVVEKDAIQPERDRYGRYLLHIWIDDQLFAKKIISDGYAKQYAKAANTYSSLLASAEVLAQMNNRWLWWDCK